MKKILIVLSATLLLTLLGCSSKENAEDNSAVEEQEDMEIMRDDVIADPKTGNLESDPLKKPRYEDINFMKTVKIGENVVVIITYNRETLYKDLEELLEVLQLRLYEYEYYIRHSVYPDEEFNATLTIEVYRISSENPFYDMGSETFDNSLDWTFSNFQNCEKNNGGKMPNFNGGLNYQSISNESETGNLESDPLKLPKYQDVHSIRTSTDGHGLLLAIYYKREIAYDNLDELLVMLELRLKEYEYYVKNTRHKDQPLDKQLKFDLYRVGSENPFYEFADDNYNGREWRLDYFQYVNFNENGKLPEFKGKDFNPDEIMISKAGNKTKDPKLRPKYDDILTFKSIYFDGKLILMITYTDQVILDKESFYELLEQRLLEYEYYLRKSIYDEEAFLGSVEINIYTKSNPMEEFFTLKTDELEGDKSFVYANFTELVTNKECEPQFK